MLNEAGFDFRFLNAAEFRSSGNHHRGGWQPFLAKVEDVKNSLYGVTPEGNIRRGDLILGIRPKQMSAEQRKMIDQKRAIYSNFSKTQAKQLRAQIKDNGLGDVVAVDEGYDEDDKGYKSDED